MNEEQKTQAPMIEEAPATVSTESDLDYNLEPLDDYYLQDKDVPDNIARSYTNYQLRHIFPKEHRESTQKVLESLREKFSLPKETLAVTMSERDELFRQILEGE